MQARQRRADADMSRCSAVLAEPAANSTTFKSQSASVLSRARKAIIMTNEITVGDVGRIVALGRDGKPRIRQQPCNLSFDDRVKNYRRRINLVINIWESRRGTRALF
jgi:hypothetical protein